MYPFSGKLIDGAESYNWLLNSISCLDGEAIICSAFLKANILEDIYKLAPKNSKVKVMARWQLGDLIVGASDLSCYEVCKEYGWDFQIKLNFHGKVFWIPNSGILVGSANATSSGFGLRPKSNSELGTVVKQIDENIQVIKGLFTDAIKVTDDIFINLKTAVDSHEFDREQINWPRNILDVIEKTDYSKDVFFLSECFHSDGNHLFNGINLNQESLISDLSLLCIFNNTLSNKLLVQKFMATKIFKWTYSTVKKNNGSLSFGGLTSALHNSLLEDPLPYRSEVKKLVQNIFSWVNLAGKENTGIEISQPNYAQVMNLI